MRKTIGSAPPAHPEGDRGQEWLDLERLARVEVSSEAPNFPIEAALVAGEQPGWRAGQRGEQTIRIMFDEPRRIRRMSLEFHETEAARTQEFTIKWAAAPDGPLREIVRQQWTFSPQGSTKEIENYEVNLDGASMLELAIRPDLNPANAYASLTKWRML